MQSEHLELKITQTFETLCKRKKIDPKSFVPCDIKLIDQFSDHVAWAFKHIYSIPYPTHVAKSDASKKINKMKEIARLHHGIQHVTRAALHTKVFANLYRLAGDKEALALTDEDIQLIQIATLFHDSGREGEGEDLWDLESGTLLYTYLTKVLGVSKDKAKLIAEASANKDANWPNLKKKKEKENIKYFELIENENGDVQWVESKTKRDRNIYQKIIHDADSLDIMRVKPFDGSYLDFYHSYAKDNDEMLMVLAHVIVEQKSWLYAQGDYYQDRNQTKKLAFEHKDSYQALLASFSEGKKTYPVMHALQQTLLPKDTVLDQKLVDSTPYEKSKGLTVENVRAALREGRVLARSIATPSGIREKKDREDEFLAALEIYKTLRTPDDPTRTQIVDKQLGKHGNLYRSTSLLGWGAPIFSEAGFLIIDPDVSDIHEVGNTDISSGFKKKEEYAKKLKERESKFSDDEKKQTKSKQFNALRKQQKLGGSSVDYGKYKMIAHSEIVTTIKDFQAIYFSKDPNFFHEALSDSARVSHPNAPVLQAIFLQKQYQKAKIAKTKRVFEAAQQKYSSDSKEFQEARLNYLNALKSKLPIFEYSGINNEISLAPDYSPKQISDMWVTMCRDYMVKKLDINFDAKYGDLEGLSLDDIKVLSMYKDKAGMTCTKTLPADAGLDPNLQYEINQRILAEKQKLLSERAAHETKISNQIAPYLSKAIRTARPEIRQAMLNDVLKNYIRICSPTTNDIHKIQRLLDNDEMQHFLQDEKNCQRLINLTPRATQAKIWNVLALLNQHGACSQSNIENTIVHYAQNPDKFEKILKILAEENILDNESLSLIFANPSIISYYAQGSEYSNMPGAYPPADIIDLLTDLQNAKLLNKENLAWVVKSKNARSMTEVILYLDYFLSVNNRESDKDKKWNLNYHVYQKLVVNREKEFIEFLLKQKIGFDLGTDILNKPWPLIESCTSCILTERYEFNNENQYMEIAEILIKYGAKVDESNSMFQNEKWPTPLIKACKEKHCLNWVKFLVKHNANINEVFVGQFELTLAEVTPLTCAIKHGNTEIAKFLLMQKNIDLNIELEFDGLTIKELLKKDFPDLLQFYEEYHKPVASLPNTAGIQKALAEHKAEATTEQRGNQTTQPSTQKQSQELVLTQPELPPSPLLQQVTAEPVPNGCQLK